MKRIDEALTEQANSMTRGQRLLADYIADHCDKAAFMSSFELAAVTGVSQSTVMRFADKLGYEGYGDFQMALQDELKYRLNSIERLETPDAPSADEALLSSMISADLRSISRLMTLNTADALRNLCTRMLLSSRVFIYGQGVTGAAASYLASYLRVLLPSVICLNECVTDPLTAMEGADSGDLLLCMSYPPHTAAVSELMSAARAQGCCLATLSEGLNSTVADDAEISLVADCGDYGIGGSLASVICLCSILVNMLAQGSEHGRRQLRLAQDAANGKRR